MARSLAQLRSGLRSPARPRRVITRSNLAPPTKKEAESPLPNRIKVLLLLFLLGGGGVVGKKTGLLSADPPPIRGIDPIPTLRFQSYRTAATAVRCVALILSNRCDFPILVQPDCGVAFESNAPAGSIPLLGQRKPWILKPHEFGTLKLTVPENTGAQFLTAWVRPWNGSAQEWYTDLREWAARHGFPRVASRSFSAIDSGWIREHPLHANTATPPTTPSPQAPKTYLRRSKP